jgi:uncharacterized protein (TIGR02117 family)
MLRPVPTARSALRAGAAILALGCCSLLLYALCALGLGLLQVNRDYRAPPQGVTIYLQHNGVHTDLLLPLANAQADWGAAFPARDFAPGPAPARPDAAAFVAIGWGDAGFYFDTPTWADLRVPVALRALSGTGPSVIHVEYMAAPAAAPNLRRLVLSPAEYARLVGHVEAAFARDARGERVAYPGRGYTANDTFYAARGHFSPLVTCNEWVREALADAGVRVPAWAPFRYALF